MKLKIFMSVFALCVVPFTALAGPVVRSGDSVSVAQGQVLEGDFYGLGSTVVVSGEALHDVYIAGGSVTVNAPVGADLTIVGGSVQVHGAVKDDLRVIGGQVTVGGAVTGDVVIMGGTVDILSTASIAGDVIFLSGEVSINGPVAGSVVGMSEALRIDAPIKGDVSVTAARSVTLGSRAQIDGNIEYRSATDLQRAQEAVVVGTIQKRSLDDAGTDTGMGSLFPIFVLLFASLTGFICMRKHLQVLGDTAWHNYGTYGLIGLAVFVATPFIAVLLMVTVLGFLVGLMLLTAYLTLIFASLVVAGSMLGAFVFRIATKRTAITILSTFIGTLLLAMLPFIPIVGPLLMFGLIVISLGGICTGFYRLIR